jgi:hypothetical protein
LLERRPYLRVVAERGGGANLSVDVSAGAAYDADGQRCRTPSTQNVPVDEDSDGTPTTVAGVGNEKWVSVSIRFKRDESQPYIDGNSNPGNFVQDEGYEWVVKQGAEAGVGLAARPALVADAVLLADVKLVHNQTQVVNANVSTTRRQLPFDLTGTVHALKAGRVGGTGGALDQLLGWLDGHVSGSADKHAASAIDYGGGGAWADGTTNPAATVEATLDSIFTRLTATTTSAGGTRKIAGEILPSGGGAPLIAAGTLFSQINSLKYAGYLEYGGGGTWADGSTNPATSVEAQLDKNISDLASTSASGGLAKVGCGARTTWLGGRTNPAATSFAALDKVITDISAQEAGDDGMERVGGEARAGSPNSLAAGSAASQAAELLGFVNARARIAVAETITAAWEFTQTLVGNLVAAGDVGGARLRSVALEEAITGTSKVLTAATGTYIFDASGIPLAQFRLGLPTVSSGNPIVCIRGKLLPGSAVVYFCDAANVGSVPANYYEFWNGGTSTAPITLTLQWSGGRWHVLGKSGAGLTGGAGTYAT